MDCHGEKNTKSKVRAFSSKHRARLSLSTCQSLKFETRVWSSLKPLVRLKLSCDRHILKKTDIDRDGKVSYKELPGKKTATPTKTLALASVSLVATLHRVYSSRTEVGRNCASRRECCNASAFGRSGLRFIAELLMRFEMKWSPDFHGLWRYSQDLWTNSRFCRTPQRLAILTSDSLLPNAMGNLLPTWWNVVFRHWNCL